MLFLWGSTRVLAKGEESEPLMVYLADGTSFPLRSWSLSYEYVTWKAGEDPAMATTHRRETGELWIGKKRMQTGGLTLEIHPEPTRRTRLALFLSGTKKTELKAEPPSRDLLSPGQRKGQLVVARSLDLRGETLTATKRELCVLSYTTAVLCGEEPAQRIVKIEFPR